MARHNRANTRHDNKLAGWREDVASFLNWLFHRERLSAMPPTGSVSESSGWADGLRWLLSADTLPPATPHQPATSGSFKNQLRWLIGKDELPAQQTRTKIPMRSYLGWLVSFEPLPPAPTGDRPRLETTSFLAWLFASEALPRHSDGKECKNGTR